MTTSYDFTKGVASIAHSVLEAGAAEAGVKLPKPLSKKAAKRAAATAHEQVRARQTGASVEQLRQEMDNAAAAATEAPTPKAKKAKVNQPICGAKKKDGLPCTAHCMKGARWCTDHRPAVQHLTDEETTTLGTLLEAKAKDGSLLEWFVAQVGWGRAKLLVPPAAEGGQ